MKWKIGGLYRKVARSTNAFKVYFPIQMRGFAIIEISFFLNVIGNLREGNVPTSPSLPMRTEWPSIAIWQACVGVCCFQSLCWVWVHHEYATSNVYLLVSVHVYWTFTSSALRHHGSFETLYQFFSYYTKKQDVFFNSRWSHSHKVRPQ